MGEPLGIDAVSPLIFEVKLMLLKGQQLRGQKPSRYGFVRSTNSHSPSADFSPGDKDPLPRRGDQFGLPMYCCLGLVG